VIPERIIFVSRGISVYHNVKHIIQQHEGLYQCSGRPKVLSLHLLAGLDTTTTRRPNVIGYILCTYIAKHMHRRHLKPPTIGHEAVRNPSLWPLSIRAPYNSQNKQRLLPSISLIGLCNHVINTRCFLIGTNLMLISLNYLDKWEPGQRPGYRVDGPRFEFGRGVRNFLFSPLHPAGSGVHVASMGNGRAFNRYKVARAIAQGLPHTAVNPHFSICLHDAAVRHSKTSLSNETDM